MNRCPSTVRQDAPSRALAVTRAAGPQPLLVEAQRVRLRRGPRLLADVGQDVHEADELARELAEDLAERISSRRLSEP